MRNSPMKQMSTGLAVLLTGVLLIGCGSTRIFYDNFEADPIGGLPLESPVGAPVGDLVYMSGGSTRGIATVVNTGELPSKILRYSNINVPGYSRYLGFIGSEIEPGTRPTLYAYWNGYIVDDQNGSGLNVWLGTAHFLSLASVRFKDGKVLYEDGSGTSPVYIEAGTYRPNRSHFVLITVDQENRQYTIFVTPGGNGQNITIGPKPILNPEALGTGRPSLYFLYNEEKNGSGKYLIDNVTISTKPPDM
jgi:hypothetical protein